MPTIYIECTSTYQTDLNTGIQRVVRNVVRHAGAIAERYGYSVSPVILDGALFAVDIETVIPEKHSTKRTQSTSARDGPGRFPGAVKYIFQKLLRLIVALLPFDPIRRFAYGPSLRRRLARWFRASSSRAVGKSIAAHQGDILLLLDASWSTLDSWSAIRTFKQDGGHVAAVIHDLIPLDCPQDCLPEHVAVFKYWLRNLASVADAFICNSRSVAQRLANYLDTQGPGHKIPVVHFHLGSELDLAENEGVRPAFAGIFSAPRPVFIVVGSIEPRKNHAFILDAFDRLWRAGEQASLVIIGRHGWLSDDILARIAHHAALGRQLFLIRDASDAELDHAYRHASALVTASRAEGFGLPIVEAFQLGLPVLCSDIPVFREIAESSAQFFPLDDPRHLTALLRDFVRASPVPSLQTRLPQPWPTWRESTEALLSLVTKIFPSSAGIKQS